MKAFAATCILLLSLALCAQANINNGKQLTPGAKTATVPPTSPAPTSPTSGTPPSTAAGTTPGTDPATEEAARLAFCQEAALQDAQAANVKSSVDNLLGALPDMLKWFANCVNPAAPCVLPPKEFTMPGTGTAVKPSLLELRSSLRTKGNTRYGQTCDSNSDCASNVCTKFARCGCSSSSKDCGIGLICSQKNFQCISACDSHAIRSKHTVGPKVYKF